MEIELKLRLPPEALAALRTDPLWSRIRPDRKQLENIYFDTPDAALARAGIGLRLRHDGQQWLQTVKGGGSSRSGLHQREEIEFAVAGPALEWRPLAGTRFAPLLTPLQSQLQPQFNTRFKRDVLRLQGARGADIELAIDHGEIVASDRREALCEIELELQDGPVDDLFSLALLLAERHPLVLDNRSKAERGYRLARGTKAAAPFKASEPADLPDADTHTLVRSAIGHSLAQWQANQEGFLRQPEDSEYLHQLRVGVRRLRVACGSLAQVLGWQAGALPPIRRGLRQLGQTMGTARDWDVFLADTWPTLAARLGDAALLQRLQEAARLLQSTAHLRAQRALENRASQALLLQLERCLASTDTAPGPPLSALEAELDRLANTLAQARPHLASLSPEHQHQLRITAKKLRYLTEFAASLYPPREVAEWLAWLKKAQAVLGGHQDRIASQSHLAILLDAAGPLPGKTRRALRMALQQQALPSLDLPAPPAACWEHASLICPRPAVPA